MKSVRGLIACVAVGITAYLVYDLRAQQAEIAALHADVGTLTHALGEARPSVTVREITREITAKPADREPEPLAAPEPSGATPGAPPPARAPVTSTEIRVRYDAKFNDERADAEWSRASQATATTKLSAVLPPSSELKSVECRASMCKIETLHQDVEHYQAFAQSAFMDSTTVPWNGGFFSTGAVEPGTGKFLAVAYLSREGQELPQLE
jgi:hypothetical protein